jgi:enoyl-CoA hydratase/carnithine racemase
VGLFCSTPSVPVSRALPQKKALELLLTGEFIDAATAAQFGLVNQVVPAEELESAVQRLVAAITNKSAYAIRSGKQMFYRQLDMELADAYAYAAEVMACDMQADDAAEGIDAFLQKRQPLWKGR